ncbi:hypothetical protein BY996DRAFT_7361030 [Phakopsora pachyrhizi]|nr:hypothetical protein BY996DRAFT_7361030 [Phakopsora pachyrhizi]
MSNNPSTNRSNNSNETNNNNSNNNNTASLKNSTSNNQTDTLGDDDEFEDFEVENWNESESDISHYAKKRSIKSTNSNIKDIGDQQQNQQQKSVTMDDLWEDNWDDDVIESDFANQLRAELEKTKSSNSNGPTPMQTS